MLEEILTVGRAGSNNADCYDSMVMLIKEKLEELKCLKQ